MHQNHDILKKTFKTYIFVVGSLILFLIVLLFLPINSDIKWSIFLIIVVILFIISIYFRPRIEYYAQQKRMDDLIETSLPPIASPIEANSDGWISNLQMMGFVLNKEFKDYYLAHRVHLDSSNIVTKRGILEVIVYIRNQELQYTDDRFNRVIRQIEDEYAKSKNKYHHYSILIIKSGKLLTEDIKKAVHEVYFNKSNHRFITIIHAFAIEKTKQIYFLQSETKSPNLFYEEAIKVLKETLAIESQK
jgi:hypothetical protein